MFKFFLKLILVLTALLAVAIIFLLMSTSKQKNSNMIFGVSFNPAYARSLGFDAGEVFRFLADDLEFKKFRFSAQWDITENEKGKYDFSELDYFMNEASARNAQVVLAVGRKTPRWPECHLPNWAKNLTYEEYQPNLEKFITEVVNRYKNHPALEMWQVENEPFLDYGACSPMSLTDLQKEIALVKNLDANHSTLATDSGELSLWRKISKAGADYFGATMYRTIWSPWTGYWRYDWLPSGWYNARLKLNKISAEKTFIAELQAEPWLVGDNTQNTPLSEQEKSMNLERLKQNIIYAQKTGLSRSYLWGGEWWYWYMKKQGKMAGEFVDYLKDIKKE